MRVTFEAGDGCAIPNKEHVRRAALLYLGRFSPLLSSVAIRAEGAMHSSEVRVEILVTLHDQQVLTSTTIGADFDAAVARSLSRVAGSLGSRTNRDRKR